MRHEGTKARRHEGKDPLRPPCFGALTSYRAFTLMELVLGLIVTSLVMSALAALLGAVAQGWKHSEQTQATSNVIVQTHVRVQKILKGVRQIGACRAGSIDGGAPEQAGVLLWKEDANSDRRIQLSELALLECVMAAAPADCTMQLRSINYPAHWTAAQKNTEDGDPLTDAEFYDEASIDWFRELVAASPYGQSTLVARNVVGSEFRRSDGASATRPAFHYLLNIQRGSTPETEYGSVTVRRPTTYPSS